MTDTNMVQRPVYLPNDLDEQLGELAFEKKMDENELIRQAVREVLERGFQRRRNGRMVDATMVMRTVYFSRKIDEQLGELAFEMETGENELIRRAVEESIELAERKKVTPVK